MAPFCFGKDTSLLFAGARLSCSNKWDLGFRLEKGGKGDEVELLSNGKCICGFSDIFRDTLQVNRLILSVLFFVYCPYPLSNNLYYIIHKIQYYLFFFLPNPPPPKTKTRTRGIYEKSNINYLKGDMDRTRKIIRIE